jgi:DeoR/GlpR family transcriptional regulator of sugar metabolism
MASKKVAAGGASAGDRTFFERETANIEEKISIAALAVRKVKAGDVIALDASSTAYNMARMLPNIPITVIANELEILEELSRHRNVRVVCPGGVMDTASRSFLGKITEKSLRSYKIDKCFISCRGVDLRRGLSEVIKDHAMLKKAMIETARQTFLLVDRSKFGVKSQFFFARLSDVDAVLTDSGALPFLRDTKLPDLSVEIAR